MKLNVHFDAFLTSCHFKTSHLVAGALQTWRFLGLDATTWYRVYTETRYGTLAVTDRAEFDVFWRRETVRTDALGHAVTNAYDTLGMLQ